MLPFKIGPSRTGYNLDRCEELLLIDAYLKVRARVGGEETWLPDFEDKFFNSDKGVTEEEISHLNRHLRRLKFQELDLPLSGWTDYMHLRGRAKMDERESMLEALRSANRQKLTAAAAAEMESLPPPPNYVELTPDEESVIRRRKEDAIERARQEEERRLLAEKADVEAAAETAEEPAVIAAEQPQPETTDPDHGSFRQIAPPPAPPSLFGVLETYILNMGRLVETMAAEVSSANEKLAEMSLRMEAMEEELRKRQDGASGLAPNSRRAPIGLRFARPVSNPAMAESDQPHVESHQVDGIVLPPRRSFAR